jgi:hypothetical protein
MGYRKIGIPFQAETRDISLFHNVQTGTEVIPASYLMCKESIFAGVKAFGALT